MNIAISMGDPAGVGPEVILKALSRSNQIGYPDEGGPFTPVIFGSEAILRRDAQLLPPSRSVTRRFRTVDDISAIPDDGDENTIWIVDVTDELDRDEISHGEGSKAAARLQLDAFDRAADAVQQGLADAIVTAPWTKSLFRAIDLEPSVHTELLGDRFPNARPVMMLAGPRLRVSLATTHVPLRNVVEQLDDQTLEQTIRTTLSSLTNLFGVDTPEVAVCGLNPHAGESGAIGHEEQRFIAPLVDRLDREYESASLHGPLPADTLFMRFRQGDIPFDAVVCMYHDQGLIPLKLMHFGQSANITIGLPIIRTSVDHGTAYDIAGEGVADPGSMMYALESAATMVVDRSTS
jgi:4-hydroxythreonine-4-phosphate dehydrogenase